MARIQDTIEEAKKALGTTTKKVKKAPKALKTPKIVKGVGQSIRGLARGTGALAGTVAGAGVAYDMARNAQNAEEFLANQRDAIEREDQARRAWNAQRKAYEGSSQGWEYVPLNRQAIRTPEGLRDELTRVRASVAQKRAAEAPAPGPAPFGGMEVPKGAPSLLEPIAAAGEQKLKEALGVTQKQAPADQPPEKPAPATIETPAPLRRDPNYFGDDYLQNIKDKGLRESVANQLYARGTLKDATELARINKLPKGERAALIAANQAKQGLDREIQQARKRASELAFIADRDPRWAARAAQAQRDYEMLMNQKGFETQALGRIQAARARSKKGGLPKLGDVNEIIKRQARADVPPDAEDKAGEAARIEQEYRSMIPQKVIDLYAREPADVEQLVKAASVAKKLGPILSEATGFRLFGWYPDIAKGKQYTPTQFIKMVEGINSIRDTALGSDGSTGQVKIPDYGVVSVPDLKQALEDSGVSWNQFQKELATMPDLRELEVKYKIPKGLSRG